MNTEIEPTEKDNLLATIEKFRPKEVKLPPFDHSRKDDHIYCVEWGMMKAKVNEYVVFEKMVSEIKSNL